MALVPGDITAASGLAKRIFDNFAANATACGFGASLTGAAETMMRAQAFCIAAALVDEITSNGEAVITTGTSALQREVNSSGTTVDTQAPTSEKTLPLR